jgi:site-specific DNA recombinase
MGHVKAAIYARISKDRVGAGLGIDRQLRECRRLAEQLGYDIVREDTDNDLSAYSGKKRPGYADLLAAITDGTVQSVICWHPDRLHRSPAELERYIDACQPGSVSTHCVRAGELDLSTAAGRMTARIVGAVARHESEHMSERIRGKKLDLAQRGQFKGGPRPFGYEPDGVTLRHVEAAAVSDGTRAVLAGTSVASLARCWNEQGIPPPIAEKWTPAAARSVLMRARNAGLAQHHGEVIGAAEWPAIVSEPEWRALVRLLSDPARRPKAGTSLRWQGSSLYLCGQCGDGTTMRSNSLWRPHRRALVPAYRCRAVPHNTIPSEPVDDLVNRTMVKALRVRARRLLASGNGRDELDGVYAELAALEERSDELAQLYGSRTITAREWTTAGEQIKAQVAELQALLDRDAAGTVLEGIVDAEDPGAAFLSAPVERRRAVVDSLVVVTVNAATGRGPGGGVDLGRVEVTDRANIVDAVPLLRRRARE